MPVQSPRSIHNAPTTHNNQLRQSRDIIRVLSYVGSDSRVAVDWLAEFVVADGSAWFISRRGRVHMSVRVIRLTRHPAAVDEAG